MTYYIVDSAVFIMRNSNLDSSLMITVPSVVDELKNRDSVLFYYLAKEGGLRVEWPEPEMVKEIKRKAEHTRDSEELSKTDIEILAKALEYRDRGVLITDDYAIQNVALQLGTYVVLRYSEGRGVEMPGNAALIHPGEILLTEFMEPLGLTAYRLAKDLEASAPRVGDIVRGKRAISADTALRLGIYFGLPAQFWLNLQNEYDLRRAAASPALKRLAPRAA